MKGDLLPTPASSPCGGGRGARGGFVPPFSPFCGHPLLPFGEFLRGWSVPKDPGSSSAAGRTHHPSPAFMGFWGRSKGRHVAVSSHFFCGTNSSPLPTGKKEGMGRADRSEGIPFGALQRNPLWSPGQFRRRSTMIFGWGSPPLPPHPPKK